MKPWFERSFSFALPTWMFPNLVERLRGTPARVEALVRPLPQEVLAQRIDEHWSIQEIVGHLLDLEPLWSGRVEDILKGNLRMRDADLTNRNTHEAGHNDHPPYDILTAFREARMAFVAQLEALDEEAVARSALHPRLEQPMRILDLMEFVAEHDDHHLAHITGLKRRHEHAPDSPEPES